MDRGAGVVTLVGAGPGDPGLLTIHALSGLAQADVVVHDALVDQRVLALAQRARLEFAGKRGGKPSATQADISKRLVELARAGERQPRQDRDADGHRFAEIRPRNEGHDPCPLKRGREYSHRPKAVNRPSPSAAGHRSRTRLRNKSC